MIDNGIEIGVITVDCDRDLLVTATAPCYAASTPGGWTGQSPEAHPTLIKLGFCWAICGVPSSRARISG